MAMVRQLATAGFRPMSKYEYIIPRLSKCEKTITLQLHKLSTDCTRKLFKPSKDASLLDAMKKIEKFWNLGFLWVTGAQLGDCLVGMPSPFSNNICDGLAFENSMMHIDFQGSQLHRRVAHLIPDKHECIRFTQLHAPWDTAVAFCNSTSFL